MLSAPEPIPAARTPRVLWVELTSKCPFDCIFCSRKFRRGSGRHLPFAAYERLVNSLVDPRKLILNYSGESIYYPELIPAIELARGRGAFVELVSAFSTVSPELVRALAGSGLGRLTVSVHATDPRRYGEIYRFGSFVDLEARLREFLELCRQRPAGPSVDLAFVAMHRNLDQLAAVAEFAARMGIRDVSIFPVMRRDDIPVEFPQELDALGNHTEEFRRKLTDTIAQAARGEPEIRFTVANPAFQPVSACLGEIPVAFPGPLPDGARIHTCEQNPFETAHVLSNGDVVACEVHDRASMGNLLEQALEEIWNGAPYRRFRALYSMGGTPECRNCVWKRAYLPGPPRSEILARDGRSAQLLHGWHEPTGEGVIWSTQQALAVLHPRAGSQSIHVSALLPPGPAEDRNELEITCNGREVGRVRNPWDEMMPFGLDFAIPAEVASPWRVGFRTRHMLRPQDHGDNRDLGFALMLLASNRSSNGAHESRHAAELALLRRWVARVDRLGARLRRSVDARFGRIPPRAATSGISVIIPERESPDELSECLEALERAGARIPEALQVIVLVNGARAGLYGALRRLHPHCQWLFAASPLGFPQAVRRGLRLARYDWVYLLNSDMAIDPEALAALLPWRAPDVFAIGSQIYLRDPTRYRDETNWTAFLIEDGLAAVHDRVPSGDATTECAYAGGGASLFQRRVLAPLAAASDAYSPFYWEDVEWGWRARKRGYRVLFCGASVARHRQHATIARYYSPEEIRTVTERNQLLFHLRNVTAAGSLQRLFEEMARAPEAAVTHFLDPGVMRSSLRVRLWNHLAAVEDRRILP